MNAKPADSLSWWVGLSRSDFSKAAREKQPEIEKSTEGKRGDRKHGNYGGPPAGVPRVKG